MWIRKLENNLNRKNAEITFNPHLFDRKENLNLDLDKVEETVRTGKIFHKKCESPNKICFKRYFGKENVTYTIITRYYDNFIEVKTSWTNKGK